MSKPDPTIRCRTAGFRFSLMDAGVILTCLSAAFWLRRIVSDAWWLFLFVPAHFFLFCNIFRVAPRRELIWSALLVLNFVAWLFAGHLNSLGIFLSQTPITIVLITAEIRDIRYHGIFAHRLNPHLDAWLKGGEVRGACGESEN